MHNKPKTKSESPETMGSTIDQQQQNLEQTAALATMGLNAFYQHQTFTPNSDVATSGSLLYMRRLV